MPDREYILRVVSFLEQMEYDRIYKVDKLAKPETRADFIDAACMYINTYEYGNGVSFIDEKFDRIRKIDIDGVG